MTSPLSVVLTVTYSCISSILFFFFAVVFSKVISLKFCQNYIHRVILLNTNYSWKSSFPLIHTFTLPSSLNTNIFNRFKMTPYLLAVIWIDLLDITTIISSSTIAAVAVGNYKRMFSHVPNVLNAISMSHCKYCNVSHSFCYIHIYI